MYGRRGGSDVQHRSAHRLTRRRVVALPPVVPRRSHAAAPVGVAVLFAGLVLGTISVLLPIALGGFLLLSAFSFLGSRVNPLSIGFYLHTKPSWTAIGVLFLAAVLLFVSAYAYYVHGLGPILPGLRR